MIKQISGGFIIEAGNSTMLLEVNEIQKPVLAYYGPKIKEPESVTAFKTPYGTAMGTATVYDEKKAPTLTLDQLNLEISSPYKGDYGSPSLLLEGQTSPVYDFVYQSFEIRKPESLPELPSPHDAEEELILKLADPAQKVEVELHYLTYKDSGVIGRYLKIINQGEPLDIRKAMSLQVVLDGEGFELVNFYGTWAGEFQKDVTTLNHLRYSFDSATGSSSARHNPYFIIKKKDTSYQAGGCYGFNLVYSGNHYEEVEYSAFDKLRVQTGISPLGFKKTLQKGESFVTPLAVLTFSDQGLNGLIHLMHDFVNAHVVPKEFAYKARPVVFNNWEGTFMKFNERKLHSLVRKAAAIGAECFVLDDGWFGKRNNDKAGLGDWTVNKKKLPHGIKGLCSYVHKKGMKFGLWFEPEMVNPDSDLFRAHPEYAIQDGIHEPCLGRNQLTLDLTKAEVRSYIIDAVEAILKSASIDFVKWDYNRNMSDIPMNSGTFFHDYILGLYQVVGKITADFPKILFENCASGGNRCDLGMLSYFAQTWVSDDTDSFERAKIQDGMVLGYPLSVMSNHVSAKISNQMLRKTSFDSKFDVACLGILGYELDLGSLSKKELSNFKQQIAFYKAHREVCQFGTYEQISTLEDSSFSTKEAHNAKEAVVSRTVGICRPVPSQESLFAIGLDPNADYHYAIRREDLDLRRFGTIVNYVLPIHLKEEGALISFIAKFKSMPCETLEGDMSGAGLMGGGLKFPMLWNGTGYSDKVSFMGDFGSRLYLLSRK
jgi:alpha-galactosidase